MYDVIISEPSNPWIAGIANLFTTEFYRHVHARLAPGGMFGQWIQAYQISEESLAGILRTRRLARRRMAEEGVVVRPLREVLAERRGLPIRRPVKAASSSR